jgi:muramoyltetrapeptide carboxypeptidase
MDRGSYGIGLYAPAGFATDPKVVERAIERFEKAGHRVVVDSTVAGRWQRFSAPDDERLAAVMRMAEDPRVELAIAVRGGYGWSRLLDRLDFAHIAAAGKRWLGHSDFTAFQLGALTATGMVTFAGPLAAYDFGAETPSEFTLAHCWDLLASAEHVARFPVVGPSRFEAQGTLWGGNLSLVAHLVGTRHLPNIDDGILFLEDVSEHPYRIERMLYQLHLAGILDTQRAVLLGEFSDYELGANDDGYDLETMIDHCRSAFAVPIFTGLPFGHCRDKLTLPVGGRCALSVEDGIARIGLSDYGATGSHQ